VTTDELDALIVRGEEQGYLVVSEVEEAIEEVDLDRAEALYGELDAHGIEVREEPERHDRASRPAGNAGAGTVDSLQLFLNEIARFPLLTAKEEVELAQRIERGDRTAKDRMINSNIRLVVSVAKRYQGHDLPLLDLIQEGIIGLIRAVEKFDWRRGYKFSTYATWWIRQAVQRGVVNKARTIRVPVHIADQERRIARAEDRLAIVLGRLPTDAEIAVELGLEEAQVRRTREAPRTVASLDRSVGEDEGVALYELLPSAEETPFEGVDSALGTRALWSAVARLPEREREVIRLRYGLGGDPVSTTKVGAMLGITRQRVQQLEAKALERLAREHELQALREHAA
jgi:RNA polymerase primary sigma factor